MFEPPSSGYLVPTLAICAAGGLWILTWVLGEMTRPRQIRPADEAADAIREVLLHRAVGFSLLGIVPAILTRFMGKSLLEFGLRWSMRPDTIWWVVLPLAVLVPVIAYSASTGRSTDRYPHLRVSIWSPSMVLVDFAAWALYLFAYEFCFRGFLLHACLSLGVWPAIAVNVVVYSLAHLPKDMREVVGAAPFGVYLCIVTLTHGGIWVAFVIHVAIAMVYDSVALRAHPDMILNKPEYQPSTKVSS